MTDDMPRYTYENPVPLEQQTSVAAIASVVLGILGWVGVFGLGGLLAVIFGTYAKSEIRKSAGRIGGDGLATAGLILGYANIAVTVLGLCLGVALLALGVITIPVCFLPFFNQGSFNFTTIP